MAPLIGQRYRCLTCGNYDLCSACEKKGHEHPLELVPQPTDDDEDPNIPLTMPKTSGRVLLRPVVTISIALSSSALAAATQTTQELAE
ncbi:unnamed protein product, partial [Rotaria sp. Silwood1]